MPTDAAKAKRHEGRKHKSRERQRERERELKHKKELERKQHEQEKKEQEQNYPTEHNYPTKTSMKPYFKTSSTKPISTKTKTNSTKTNSTKTNSTKARTTFTKGSTTKSSTKTRSSSTRATALCTVKNVPHGLDSFVCDVLSSACSEFVHPRTSTISTQVEISSYATVTASPNCAAFTPSESFVVSTAYFTPSDVISVIYSTIIDVESSYVTPVFTNVQTTQLPEVTVTTAMGTPSSLIITTITLPTPTCKFFAMKRLGAKYSG